MNNRTARLELLNARHDFLAARMRYLAAAKLVEKRLYRKDLPAFLRPQI